MTRSIIRKYVINIKEWNEDSLIEITRNGDILTLMKIIHNI